MKNIVKPKRGRPPKTPDTLQVSNLKGTVGSLIDDLDAVTMERDRLRGEVAELQRMLPHIRNAPSPEQGRAIDDEMIYLRRLIGLLENLKPDQRKRLLAMVDARYFDNGPVK